MLFNSLEFLIFFPLVVILYFLLPHKYRWLFLLIASCIFYMAFIPAYILILFILILIDYFAGILIEQSDKHKKTFLIVSIAATSFALLIFKYFNFFTGNFNSLAHFIGWNYSIKLLALVLPIGLSFHTFQSLSYVIEVYRGKQKAERNLGIYALYVMFFPQLVAGPIERPGNLLHQFYEKHNFDYGKVTSGLRLMAWGMFKKVVVADRLARFVNIVYNNPTESHGIGLIIATVFFAFQIYCDFSGYSDIAIGAARVLGFKLMNNFDIPYISRSVAEFWRRWHISLSTWFRDYFYISLGGNRVSLPRWYLNIFLTFLLSGLWHGANWTFVVWGALHGFYVIFENLITRLKNAVFKASTFHLSNLLTSVWRVFLILITFLLVNFAWIFFRANNLKDALYIATHLFSNFRIYNIASSEPIFLGSSLHEFIIALLLIVLVDVVHLVGKDESVKNLFVSKTYLRWSAYYLLLIAILALGVFKKSPFIYFQF